MCHLYRPENRREVAEVLNDGARSSYIARGCGRSYADASLNRDAGVVSMLRVNRMIELDEEAGLLECEGGTTLREMIHVLLPRGFFLVVTPGTADVTVGGAIASDVHGRNHRSAGSFAETVEELRLLLPGGEEVDCSAKENADVFHATVGGLGLTGVILRARLRLRKIESPALSVTTAKTVNLAQTLAVLEKMSQQHEYAVCWMDSAAGGPRAGRGIVEGAHHVVMRRSDTLPKKPRTFRVPLEAPPWLLNRHTIKAFNSLRLARAGESKTRMHIADFMYPLDRIAHWNRLYGPRGFAQYQLAIPLAQSEDAIRSVLECVHRSRHTAFLATLKRFGAPGNGLLSFPVEGFTLALDFPVRRGLEDLTRSLDEIVIASGGRVYLGKNPWLTRESLERMYPRAQEFLSIRNRLDPKGLISSSFARRAGLTS